MINSILKNRWHHSFILVAAMMLLIVQTGFSFSTFSLKEDGNYQKNRDAGGFLNIVPPGQDGVVNAAEASLYQLTKAFPRHFNDQTEMYEKLVYEAPIKDENLMNYFKDASFGVKADEIGRKYSPISGVTIFRDKEFGVPHIYGTTRQNTMFAVGYATAEDRLFLMDLLRHLGRARVSEFLGASEANKKMDREQLAVAPYTEEELTKQYLELCELGEDGAQVCEDVKAYSKGVNAYISKALLNPSLLPAEYPGLQVLPQKWKPEDTVAIASVVGGIFGKGGGNEVASGRFLSQLQKKYGNEEGKNIWSDFRSANDKEAPVTTTTSFPYNNHDQIDPDSTALLDLETADQTIKDTSFSREINLDGPFGEIKFTNPLGMSNALLVGGKQTKSGKPIAVFGPQTGYFTPQLLVEMDIHGPGIDARGVAFAGTNMYVQLGRGNDYAWSATSASSDNVDEWVLKLCEPDGKQPTMDSAHYLYKSKCTPMEVYEHTQIAKPTLAGIPEPSIKNIIYKNEVQRSVYGPIVGRGTVNGKPVAISEQRSTYGKEFNSAIGFMRVNDPDFMSNGTESFRKAFEKVDYTFNWFYVDQKDIAYQHSGLLPIRNPKTDPDLPTWGDGNYDWTGDFLKSDSHPFDVNPKSGYLLSWNNKTAPDFRANDANFNYGSIFRSDFLEKRIKQKLNTRDLLTRADVVNITADASTVDLKGQEVYPLVLKLMDTQAPAGADQEKLKKMKDLLAEWVKDGGHRRDRYPVDGVYDHAVAIAIGDEFFKMLKHEMFGGVLKDTDLPNIIEDSPQLGQGSAYMNGYYTYFHKNIRQLLNEKVISPWHRTYCYGPNKKNGRQNLDSCKSLVWTALSKAADHLEDEYGSARVDDWVYDSKRDEIIQSGVGLLSAPNMQWMNRPTFQQVVEVGEK
ncbi:penicillin acylase family protein [Mesobacillus harenae]|uniref:penicillin acylase family protein n=1 Tax=Mesobacillus harenae TaxID=2213203 RepID=UPI00157FD7F3|nr:penicillin acylase family protein [Mesobacillus harenae]